MFPTKVKLSSWRKSRKSRFYWLTKWYLVQLQQQIKNTADRMSTGLHVSFFIVMQTSDLCRQTERQSSLTYCVVGTLEYSCSTQSTSGCSEYTLALLSVAFPWKTCEQPHTSPLNGVSSPKARESLRRGGVYRTKWPTYCKKPTPNPSLSISSL